MKDNKTPKIIHISGKVSDMSCVQIEAEDGTIIKTHDGYFPQMLLPAKDGGEHGQDYGDYIDFSIDIETGKIINWVKPTDKLNEFIVGEDIDEDDVF